MSKNIIVKDKNQQKHVFEYTFRQYDDDTKSNITDFNDQQLHNLSYNLILNIIYQYHEFPKLTQSLI